MTTVRRLSRVALLAVAALFLSDSSASAQDAAKLVGTWDAPKTKEFPYDITLQFAKDGKLKMTVKAPKPVTRDCTYKLDGDKLSITRKDGEKEDTMAWTVKSLDDKKLVVVDDKGTTTEYAKKAPPKK